MTLFARWALSRAAFYFLGVVTGLLIAGVVHFDRRDGGRHG